MKGRKPKKTLHSRLRSQPIQIEFTHPTATQVYVAGSFNNWQPDATRMLAMGNGRWLTVLVLPPGTYEYRLVADGEWITDPLVWEKTPNPFGGFNSVLHVERCTR